MRRKRLTITPADDRYSDYYTGIETGDAKWLRKREDAIEKIKRYGFKFTTMVDDIVSSILNEFGVIGKSRLKYFVVGRKVAKWIVKYSDSPTERIDSHVKPMMEALIEAYRLRRDIMNTIYDRLMSERFNLAEIAQG